MAEIQPSTIEKPTEEKPNIVEKKFKRRWDGQSSQEQSQDNSGRNFRQVQRNDNRRWKNQNNDYQNNDMNEQQGSDKFRRGGPGGRDRDFDRILEKLSQISGSTVDLPPLDTTEKKFSVRNRLYVGNLPSEITEDEIKELIKPYGEVDDLFHNKEKSFCFLRLDYLANAMLAKRELDGKIIKGKTLRIRFAPNSSAIKVKNLSTYVTNELLHAAFSAFGEIEKCVVSVDERGKSTCEGIVEYTKRTSAQNAIRRCSDYCFFLTSSLKPVIVELHEQLDEIDGFSERSLPNKKNPDWYRAREIGPRFGKPGSFEQEYGSRWKTLNALYKQKFEALKREQTIEEEKLEAQMELARYEHETERLKEELRQRELDRERQKREWEMREKKMEEEKSKHNEQLRRIQENLYSNQYSNTTRRNQGPNQFNDMPSSKQEFNQYETPQPEPFLNNPQQNFDSNSQQDVSRREPTNIDNNYSTVKIQPPSLFENLEKFKDSPPPFNNPPSLLAPKNLMENYERRSNIEGNYNNRNWNAYNDNSNWNSGISRRGGGVGGWNSHDSHDDYERKRRRNY